MTPYEPRNPNSKAPKLRRLPSNARISKRPLLRPAIPSPYTSSASPKIVYISAKTPFISAVKRVRKLLALINKRTIGKVDLSDAKSDKARLRALGEAGKERGKEPEEVILKATNRAIEKALGMAIFFQGQADVRVRLRTGSVGAVDDVVVDEGRVGKERRTKNNGGEKSRVAKGGDEEHQDSVDGTQNAEAEEEDLPETQIRKVSVLEVGISLR